MSASAEARASVAAPHAPWVVPDPPWRDGDLTAFLLSWPAFGTRLPSALWLPVLDGAHRALNLATTRLRSSRSSAVEPAELDHELLVALCDPGVREKILAARESPMGVLAATIDERYRAQRGSPGWSLDDAAVNADAALVAAGRTAAAADDIVAMRAEEAASSMTLATTALERLLTTRVGAASLHDPVRRAVQLVCGSRKLAESHERALAADIAPHVPQLTTAQLLAIIAAVLGVRGRRRRTSILGALLTSPELGAQSLTVQYALARFARDFTRPQR